MDIFAAGNEKKITSSKHTNRDIPSGIKLINTSTLKAHEKTDPNRVTGLQKSIASVGIKYPVVADKETNIILDGHHRHKAFTNLSIKNIPVYYVDYFDDKIILDSWKNKKLTKQDVINKVNSGKLFPIKTTKHMLKTKTGQNHISTYLPEINLDITLLRKNRQ